VGLGQLDRLLEDAIVLLQPHRLLPVIECAGDEDLIRSVFPKRLLADVEPKKGDHTYHEKVYLPMSAEKIAVQSGIGGVQMDDWTETCLIERVERVGGGWEATVQELRKELERRRSRRRTRRLG
jgi:hypothetical protein